MPLRIALDTGPLHGHLTGVGVAVTQLVDALDQRDDIELARYVLSFRAQIEKNEQRLRLPAALATRVWGLADVPKVDRWLPDVDLVHGTNYVVPPTRRPAVVTVYDCWFLAHPDQAAPSVRRAASLLRRAVQRGAHVHTSSAATADQVRQHLGTDRVSVVHLGPPAARAAEAAIAPDGIALGQQFIVSIGTLERRKGLPSLVRAFGEIASDRTDLRLVLAGVDGDDGEAVARAVDRDSTGGTTTSGSNRCSEPWREGLAAPQRSTARVSVTRRRIRIPRARSTVGQPAGRRDVRSARCARSAATALRSSMATTTPILATQLVNVLDNGTTRLGLIEAGHRNVQRFSWRRTADELVTLYTRVVDEATTM